MERREHPTSSEKKQEKASVIYSGAGTNFKIGGTCAGKNFCRAPPLFWLYSLQVQ